MFRKRKEKRWQIYKEEMVTIAEELELPNWFEKLLVTTIVKEEQKRPIQELAGWLEQLEANGALPPDFSDESMLLDVYRKHADWVEKKVAFHIEIREADGETFESLLKQIGAPITSMSLGAQKAYLAIWGEALNVIAQTVGFDQTGGGAF